MSVDQDLMQAILLACVERKPIDFRRVDEAEVKRAKAGIKRANGVQGASFRDLVIRNDFLCACLEFTTRERDEHLIVGYGYRNGRTTEIERVHRVAGEQRRVAVPDNVRQEIRRHHFHRSDAEVVVFHNHPRMGDEPEWFYALKALLQDLPIASQADREQLRQHGFNTVGMLRQLLGQGRVLFYLGESGLVKEFRIPALLPFLDQLDQMLANWRKR